MSELTPPYLSIVQYSNIPYKQYMCTIHMCIDLNSFKSKLFYRNLPVHEQRFERGLSLVVRVVAESDGLVALQPLAAAAALDHSAQPTAAARQKGPR